MFSAACAQLVTWIEAARFEEVSIRTNRLLLRDLHDTDGPELLRFYADHEVMAFEIRTEPLSEEEVSNLVRAARTAQRQQPRTSYTLAIVLKAERQVIGECSLTPIGQKPGCYLMGYCLHRDYWAHGYATEAVRALIDYAFTRLRVVAIGAGCRIENQASRQVLGKVGMRQARELEWAPGIPSVLFAINRAEWEAQQRFKTPGCSR